MKNGLLQNLFKKTIDDAVEGTVLAMEKGGNGEIYHIGTMEEPDYNTIDINRLLSSEPDEESINNDTNPHHDASYYYTTSSNFDVLMIACIFFHCV